MSIIGTIYEDVTTDVLGDIGSWQWLVTFVSTVLMIPSIFNEHEDMFLLQIPRDVMCIPHEGYKGSNISLCSFTMNNGTEVACIKWHVKLLWIFWLRKSWLVFCDDQLKLMSTAMICRLGLMFGCVIYGLVSDSFGRKKAIVMNVIFEVLIRLVITFCDSEGWFRLFIFLRSLFGSASLYMGLIIVCEIASNRWRSWLNTIVMTPRLVAMVCSVPLASYASNTETYIFLACLFELLLIFPLRWIPESPQWLLYNRKISTAEKIVLKAALRNGLKFSGEFKIKPVNHRAYNCLDEPSTCLGVLTTYNIRIIFLVTMTIWSLYYYLWGCLYLRVYSERNFDSLLIEIFGFLSLCVCLTVLLSQKLKLRKLLMVNIILTGAFTFCGVILVQKEARNLLSSMALASGITGHALVLNITPRLFATNVRGTLFGFCHASGQVGAMISYLVFLFQAMNDSTYLALEVVISLILVILCLVVPDIDGRELPDVMEDMDYFSELSKPLRWATQKTTSPSREEVIIRIYSFGSAGRVMSSHSEERQPARPIGHTRLWRRIIDCMRRKSRQANRD